jgi:nitrite reductase/ring-hydroxylating ferredoxin subunit
MSEFLTAARLDQLAPERGLALEVAGASLAVFLVGGEVHALDDLCPHSGGPLSEGPVENGCVTCPWHGARFELATGRSVGEFQCRDVRRHAARVVDGRVEVALTPRAARRS